MLYDVDSPKKAVNLTANANLLQNAKDVGMNLSRIFEDAVIDELRATLEAQWLIDNKEAISNFNRRIENDGVFAANKRRF